jgi:hypothetical protein
MPIQYVWRFSIKSDEMSGDTENGSHAAKMHTFDLYIDSFDTQEADIAAPHDRTGIYSSRQYIVYEKELWSNADVSTRQELCVA